MKLYEDTDCLPHVKPEDAFGDHHYAFPVSFPANDKMYVCPGMTLRDWFAGRAPDMPEWWEHHETGMTALERIASWRYAYADAMLAARADAVLREAGE